MSADETDVQKATELQDEAELEEGQVGVDDDGLATTSDVLNTVVDPERKTGVIYLATVPPRFTASKIRSVFSAYGEVGRLYMQAEKRGSSKARSYKEGWIEFKRKRIAKLVAERLNAQQVGGKRRHPAYDSLWSIKYLHGFKWSNLIEQLTSERRVEEQRMRSEITQARRQARHFVDQVEKSERLKKAEQRVAAEGGEWTRQETRVVAQKPVESKKPKLVKKKRKAAA